ncbi:unnamed protein product [Schistocephalus solidus]|uniref:SGNH_hydro domain-containing protein n=1 Tax=Schistocephalus solidus TaxID=70667 RepID=A0A183S7L8_SCHSO|nr:unnamed protein product [Schistocephalus solidus]
MMLAVCVCASPFPGGVAPVSAPLPLATSTGTLQRRFDPYDKKPTGSVDQGRRGHRRVLVWGDSADRSFDLTTV